MTLENATPVAPVQHFVMPSSLDIRSEAQAVLDATTLKDLAEAVRDGKRIQAYEPITEWLAAGQNGTLHLRQMAESILWELRERKAAQELRQIMLTALGYLID